MRPRKGTVMSLLWIIVLCLVALVWVISVVDIVRQRYSGWTTAGWLALIVILPIVGSIIYWFARKPTREDAEQQYLAEADRRRSAGARPFDSTGMGP
jgi:cytochrome bd-type quinol oxidase subunit 2